MVFINLKVIATSKADIEDFLQLCGVIQHLGEVGVSRKISLVIDGDGSGRFTFSLGGEELIPSSNIDIGNLPTIWLGE